MEQDRPRSSLSLASSASTASSLSSPSTKVLSICRGDREEGAKVTLTHFLAVVLCHHGAPVVKDKVP